MSDFVHGHKESRGEIDEGGSEGHTGSKFRGSLEQPIEVSVTDIPDASHSLASSPSNPPNTHTVSIAHRPQGDVATAEASGLSCEKRIAFPLLQRANVGNAVRPDC